MKTLFYTAALAPIAFTIATVSAFPAKAGTVAIGNSTARDCYEAAVARTADRNSFYHCNLALDQEGLSRQDRAATLNNRGALYLRGHNYRSAGRDFDLALKSDANNAEAWLNRAIVSLQMGGDAEALPWIEKSLALNTVRPALAYYSRSIAFERTGNLRAAYNDLRRAVELAPGWRAPLEDLKRYQVRRR
jgi:tetratricopeptide (TPR) repeat protein